MVGGKAKQSRTRAALHRPINAGAIRLEVIHAGRKLGQSSTQGQQQGEG